MQLLIEGPGVASRHVTLDRESVMILGREPSCELYVTDPRLSRRHVQLHWDGSALRFLDLGSANGCLLNGAAASEGLLAAGQSLHVGDTRITLMVSRQKPVWDVAAFHARLLDRLDLREISDDTLKKASFRDEVGNIAIELAKAEQPHAEAEAVRAFAGSVLDEVFGLGPLEGYLSDDTVSEIMVNAPDEVWIERDGKVERANTMFSSDTAVRRVIDRIVAPLGRRIDESSPLVDARLQDGSRVNAVIPPIALKGSTLTIRKFRKQRIVPGDLVRWGSIDSRGLDLLRSAVSARKNIIVSGGTGAGKTTLLNTLANFIDSAERIVTIEDAAELQLPQPHVVRLESRPANLEGKGAISIRDLLKNALRMRPDRIIVGECRSGEALDMLQAMNTGHDGSLSTVHANSPGDALRRIETLVLFAGTDLPHRAVREQVASAIHLVVQQSRMGSGKRCVTEITAVKGLTADGYSTETLWTNPLRLESASHTVSA